MHFRSPQQTRLSVLNSSYVLTGNSTEIRDADDVLPRRLAYDSYETDTHILRLKQRHKAETNPWNPTFMHLGRRPHLSFCRSPTNGSSPTGNNDDDDDHHGPTWRISCILAAPLRAVSARKGDCLYKDWPPPTVWFRPVFVSLIWLINIIKQP